MTSRPSIAFRLGPLGRRMVSPSPGSRPATSRNPFIMARSPPTATTAPGGPSPMPLRSSRGCPQREPEDAGQHWPQPPESWGKEIDEGGRDRHTEGDGQCGEAEKHARRRRKVPVPGEGPSVPLVPLVTEAAIGLDMDE